MADNKTAKDGSGISFTMAFKEWAGNVFAKKVVVYTDAGVDAVGEVQTTPTANTILGRLKAIYDALVGGIDFTDDYTRQMGKFKLVNDAGVVINPATATTAYKSLDLDESEEEVAAVAATLYWVHVVNLAATKRYLKFYNATAANVTVGTTTPVMTFPIPTMGDTNGAGFALSFGPAGQAFSTALTIAATTGFADNDTGAPGANEVIINLGYV